MAASSVVDFGRTAKTEAEIRAYLRTISAQYVSVCMHDSCISGRISCPKKKWDIYLIFYYYSNNILLHSVSHQY